MNKTTLDALADGRHHDPFRWLGMHFEQGRRIVRTLQPQAQSVALLVNGVANAFPMERVHPGGIFEIEMPAFKRSYRLRITYEGGNTVDVEDVYRFPPMLGDLDL